jgi:ubiquitin carboxyl-terminal hydrolase L5
VITSDNFFRTAHNSLSPPPSVSLAELDLQREKSGDAYHFIVYLPHAGHIYEFDGLKKAPVRHRAFAAAAPGQQQQGGEGNGSGSGSGSGGRSEEDWTAAAREVIEARIATYPPESVRSFVPVLSRSCSI